MCSQILAKWQNAYKETGKGLTYTDLFRTANTVKERLSMAKRGRQYFFTVLVEKFSRCL